VEILVSYAYASECVTKHKAATLAIIFTSSLLNMVAGEVWKL